MIVYLLILSLACGGYGGSLTIPRVLAVFFSPLLLERIPQNWTFVGKYVIYFSLFYIFCLFSMLWTPDPSQGAKELVYYFVHFILFLEILVFSKYANDTLKIISLGWLSGILITLPIAIWELSSGQHLTVMSQYEDAVIVINGITVERPYAAATFGGFNGYITYLCWSIPFSAYLLLHPAIGKAKIIFVGIILLITSVVMITNASRGGLLSIIIMFGIFLLMRYKGRSRIAMIGVVVFAIIFLLNSDFDFLLGIKSRGAGGGMFSDDDRLVLWKKALEIFESSIGIGVGIGGIKPAMSALNAPVSVPHNLFLEILAQYGFIVFFVFVGFLLSALRRVFYMKNQDIRIVVCMFIFALPMVSIIDSGYLLSPEVYAAFSSLAVFTWLNKIKNADNRINHKLNKTLIR